MADLKIPLRSFLIDLALNMVIPLACYRLARARGATELQALIASSVYPMVAGLWSLLHSRKLNPFSLLVLVGLVVSAVALALGGSARVLLLRESLPTLAVGLLALASLVSRRPLMLYFARHMVAGNDPEKTARFNLRSREPAILTTHRRITAVWGVTQTLEFCVKVVMVYTLSSAQVLVFGPVLFYATMIATMLWTVRYAKSRSRQLQFMQPEQTGVNVNSIS